LLIVAALGQPLLAASVALADECCSVAPNGLADDFVNLASDARSSHILDGHRAGAGSGKSEFRAGWADDLTLSHVADIATDYSLTWIQQTGEPGAAFAKNGDPVRFYVDGIRDGVEIRVIIELGGGASLLPSQLVRAVAFCEPRCTSHSSAPASRRSSET